MPKTNPKTSPLYLLVSIMTIFPFLLCWWKRSRFQSLQSRRFEARRGLAEATPRTQHVLAQGQSEAHGDSKLYNTIVEVPARLKLEVVGNCAASQALRHLRFSEVFWGFASDCCFQYVLRFSIDWWSFLRFWFRRLLPFYFRFWGWLGTRAAIILF